MNSRFVDLVEYNLNECGLADRAGCKCGCVVAPPWHDDLQSVVWPAQLAACVDVLWLLPDTVTCQVWSVQQWWLHVYVCCGSSLTCWATKWGLANREDRMYMCVGETKHNAKTEPRPISLWPTVWLPVGPRRYNYKHWTSPVADLNGWQVLHWDLD